MYGTKIVYLAQSMGLGLVLCLGKKIPTKKNSPIKKVYSAKKSTKVCESRLAHDFLFKHAKKY